MIQALDNQLTKPLAEAVQTLVTRYLAETGLNSATNLRDLLLKAIEPPLLEEVLTYCHYNQTKTAKALGLNRGTCREKLKYYFDDRYCKLSMREVCE